MAALLDTEDFEDDWTTRFIREIEDWVRERYLREMVCAGVATPTTAANTLPRHAVPTTYIPR